MFVLSSEGPKRLSNTCSVGYVLFCPCSQKSEALALQEHPRQAPQRRRIKSDGMAVMAGIWLRPPDLTRLFCGSFPGVLKQKILVNSRTEIGFILSGSQRKRPSASWKNRLDQIQSTKDVPYYKSVRFSSFSLGIEGQKRVLRIFEILINISTIITEIEGFIIKNTKRGGIPSQ